MLQNNAGIYFRNDSLHNSKDALELKEYCQLVTECWKRSAIVGCFQGASALYPIYHRFSPGQRLHNRVVEPWFIEKNNWFQTLQGKKVLIISPFVDSMKSQISKLDKVWSNLPTFSIPSDIQWVFYKSFNTIAGNKIHSSWKETFEHMKKDISQLEFDVALLSCGGYGPPLCLHIHQNMHKTAIYVGGALQILFGIKGKRWNERADFRRYMNQYWIQASPHEIPQNHKRVENGCYWN